jgi:glycerol-3-phosphate cytidylyltransferase-like family protein
VFRLKGRYPVNSQDERKYMIDSLRSVKECRISRGMGLLDFVDELRDIGPDVFVVNEDGAHESKAQLCREPDQYGPRRLPRGGCPLGPTTLRDGTIRSTSISPAAG